MWGDGTIIHLAEEHRPFGSRLLVVAIHPHHEVVAKAQETCPVHRQVAHGSIKFQCSITAFACLGTHPAQGSMPCLVVIIHTHTVVHTASLIIIDNEMRSLLGRCIAIIHTIIRLLLAERAEAGSLIRYMLLIGRLYKKSHVEIGKLIDYRMIYHFLTIVYLEYRQK